MSPAGASGGDGHPAMPTVTVSDLIEAAPARLWGCITDLGLLSQFHPIYFGASWIDEPPAKGARLRILREYNDRVFDTRAVVDVWEPERRFGFQVLLETGEPGVIVGWTMAPSGQHTNALRVSLTMTLAAAESPTLQAAESAGLDPDRVLDGYLASIKTWNRTYLTRLGGYVRSYPQAR